MKPVVLLSNIKYWDKPLYFGFLCLFTCALTFVSNSLLVTDDLILGFWSEHVSYERATEMLDLNRRWSWVSYAIIPVYYLLKMFLVSVCIYTGIVLADIDVSFRKVFQVALFAEAIFLVPVAIKLVWFGWVQTEYTLLDVQSFYPFSLLNLFDRNTLDSWLIYPMQAINLFEMIYFLLLAYGLYLVTKRSYSKMLGLALYTYGTGLFIWIVSVMFIVVTLTG